MRTIRLGKSYSPFLLVESAALIYWNVIESGSGKRNGHIWIAGFVLRQDGLTCRHILDISFLSTKLTNTFLYGHVMLELAPK